jgi:DNA-binding NarL/FixJ family response regulator
MKQPLISIVIVDDHEVGRPGLRSLFSLETDREAVPLTGYPAFSLPKERNDGR